MPAAGILCCQLLLSSALPAVCTYIQYILKGFFSTCRIGGSRKMMPSNRRRRGDNCLACCCRQAVLDSISSSPPPQLLLPSAMAANPTVVVAGPAPAVAEDLPRPQQYAGAGGRRTGRQAKRKCLKNVVPSSRARSPGRREHQSGSLWSGTTFPRSLRVGWK
jgi:hypothetical protein